MNTTITESLPESAQALRRMLGDCPVVTPEALAQFGAWLLAVIKDQSRDMLAEGGQQWARPCQLAVRFGCRRSQMSEWLAALRAAGTVRICRPQLPDGRESNLYYNVADIERAWLLKSAEPPAQDAKAQARAQQHPFRRTLPPHQQAGLRAMEELKEKIRRTNSEG